MPRQCTLCGHPDRLAIETALRDGCSLRQIAATWAVSKTSLIRHRDAHLATATDMSQRAQELLAGTNHKSVVGPNAPRVQEPQSPKLTSQEPPTTPVLSHRAQRPPSLAATDHARQHALAQYRAVRARIATLEAIPASLWPKLCTRPREEVLSNLRRWQSTLAERVLGTRN